MVVLGDLIKICISTSNEATVPKVMVSFCKMWAMLVVGAIYLAISAAAPLRECMMLSWTTDSG